MDILLLNIGIQNYSKYLNTSNNYYMGDSKVYKSNNTDGIHIILPIYIKLMYKAYNLNSIYNSNIYMYWNNRYIVINTKVNTNNIYYIYKNLINNSNHYINSKYKHSDMYSYKHIYISYIFWYIYTSVSICFDYKYIYLYIYFIYNPLFNINLLTNYIYSAHNNYSIDIIYSNIYKLLNNITKYDGNNTDRLFSFTRCIILQNGRWNSANNTINSSKYKKLHTFYNVNNSKIIQNRIVSKNEYGTNSLNVKLYYYNNVIFNTEYIFLYCNYINNSN